MDIIEKQSLRLLVVSKGSMNFSSKPAFELVTWWAREGKAVTCAYRALHLRGYSSVRQPEAFATIIRCTSDPAKVDDRTRSKWSRVLRYAAEYKDLGEPLRDFIKRKGGINKCASRFARRWAQKITRVRY